MISKGSKIKYIKRTCVLMLGVVLVFTQNGISVLAEQSEDHDINGEIVFLEEQCDTAEAVADELAENIDRVENVQVAFEMEQYCNGVKVLVSALKGVFPEGSYFEVREIKNTEENDIDKAISEIRDKNEQVAVSYTYDITVYDVDGNEIEPNTEYGQVSVTFSMNEAQDSNLQAKVYHIEDSGDELSAEELETNVSGDEVNVLTDGFSYYVVEFEYTDTNNVPYEYFIKSSEEVKLVDILNRLGFSNITNDAISDAESDNNGLTVGKRDGIWYVCSTASFSSNADLNVSFVENGQLKPYIIKAKYEQSDTGVTYLYGIISNKYVLKVCSDCTILTDATDKLEGGKYYYVSGNVNCTGRLQVEANEDNPAHLILGENATLTLDKGISVNQGNCLHIYAETEEDMGSLKAYGDVNDAGIGSDGGYAAGTISIYSGIIESHGGTNAAGIGGGNDGSGGCITINGGKVTAKGGDYAAGIGSGYNGGKVEIIVNDGTIKAMGGAGAAGIGAGIGAAQADVKVNETKFGKITPEDLAKGKLPKTPVKNDEPSISEDVTETATEDSDVSVSTVADEPLVKGFQGMGNLRCVCTYAMQGPLCRAAFKAATPTGFAEAFSFNLYMDATGKNTPDYNRKAGRLTLNIPKRFVKNGRTFALIGVDKNGKTKVFYDIDKADETFTANLDMEGYAFLLIYSDSAAKSDRAFSSLQTGSIYTVKSGDTLSAIAGQLGVTLRRLVDMNNLDDPDKLSIGQRIKY